MNQLSNLSRLPIFMLLIFFISYHFGACTGPKEGLEDVTATKTKKKAGKDVMLLYSDDVLTKAAYEDIKGNIPRLKAMMAGRFVQYNTNADTARKVYSAWKVNGGKDSMVIYQLPVGEPNKDGHWMYHYQFMTSLPDEPVYAAFSRMTEVNRDTIMAVYYEIPEGFASDVTIPQILAKPEVVFKDFNFEGLQPSKTGEIVYYDRKSPLEYHGVSRWTDSKSTNPDREGGYDADYYVVTPEKYVFGIEVYNRDKKFLGRTRGERLVKEARVQPEYIGR